MQLITTYTIIFVYEHTLYGTGAGVGESGISIKFPTSIGLPDAGTIVVVAAQDGTDDFFVATTGVVQTGNIIIINNIFGSDDPPDGSQTIIITIDGIKNPNSSQPAGNIVITTTLGGYTVDEGESNGTFTPTSG